MNSFKVPRSPINFSILIPASLVSEVRDLKIRTFKVGQIARAAAIFRVNEIVVYHDNDPNVKDQERDGDFIVLVLNYMETPQYLRKILFPVHPWLKYAGVLPPLRTPHHPIEDKFSMVQAGEIREGCVTEVTSEGALVDVGLDQLVLVTSPNLKPKARVTIRITDMERPLGEIIRRDEISQYWGYCVKNSKKPLGMTVKELKPDFVIGTSKNAPFIQELKQEILEKLKKIKNCVILFGSPFAGIDEILAREKLTRSEIAGITINTIPNQGTETVRTQEAVFATLALLNTLI
ncbi:MAG: RNA-binding protein [Euryarchaeota archaeon]|nr:RNA-binding protein [Euryarchaeota archaeon]